MLEDKYAKVSKYSFYTAVVLLIDAYTFNILGCSWLFGDYLTDSIEVILSYILLIVAFLSLQAQYSEDKILAEKFVNKERDDFLRKERVVTDMKTNIARDMKRERMSGSKHGRFSVGRRDAMLDRDSVLDNFSTRKKDRQDNRDLNPNFGRHDNS